MHNIFNSLQDFKLKSGKYGKFYSLPQLEKEGVGKISRLPITIRIILESLLRNYDGNRVTENHIKQLAAWQPNAKRVEEIPFIVSRILLQDYTGVPLLADLVALRGAVEKAGGNPISIEPLIPVDFVIDHSVQTNHVKGQNVLQLNMALEFKRNKERYKFMKWGEKAFKSFRIIPPGTGIVHQINLEYLAKGVFEKNNIYYPDTVIGTDSHTTMVNGIGIVGWGSGGIEAEASMLGQPIYLMMPDVVGVHLYGSLQEGVTATDLVLTITETLRKANVVGKFVEYFGRGIDSLTVPDRATIANMAPDYGATMGFFPTDQQTIDYFKATGRNEREIDALYSYLVAQNLFGIPDVGQCDYTEVIEIDLRKITPSVAGPARPQDRVALPKIKNIFNQLLIQPHSMKGYEKMPGNIDQRFPIGTQGFDIGHGDILIAGITSCTNTSNPGLLLAAGLLAKKAVARGLSVRPHIKTSLTPGSRVVSEYLKNSGLQSSLDTLGFQVAAYGCATCTGNVGDLDQELEAVVLKNDLIVSSVLSGNRNFEARIHPSIKANFLASPPLVVAFAIAGRININLEKEPLGIDKNGTPVYLKDIWPSSAEIAEVMKYAICPDIYRKIYSEFQHNNPLWSELPTSSHSVYDWDPASTYIAEPPFLKDFDLKVQPVSDIKNARALALLSDSVTTDHISPAGSIQPDSPAGQYLLSHGVAVNEFNSFGARRGHHEIMVRGSFSNVRLKNFILPEKEGGFTLHQPTNDVLPIYEAAMRYIAEEVPTIVFAGSEYGTGSSRDWAAKGTYLLGVKAVIARSFERIHRNNLIRLGVLPCQFKDEDSIQSLQITGEEEFDILGINNSLQVNQTAILLIKRKNGTHDRVELLLRVDSEMEIDYFRHGGILPYMLRKSLTKESLAA